MFKMLKIFVPIWFAFLALLAIGTIGVVIWAGVELFHSEPEDIGKFFGRIISGYEDAR